METCSEELYVERMVSKGLKTVVLSSTSEKSAKSSAARSPTFQLVWGTTMYHIDDLPFDTNSLPDVYTQFRKVPNILFIVLGSLHPLALLIVFLTRCFFIWWTAKLQSVEAKCAIRDCIRLPALLGPPASIDNWGSVPSLDKLGLQPPSVCLCFWYSATRRCTPRSALCEMIIDSFFFRLLRAWGLLGVRAQLSPEFMSISGRRWKLYFKI